MSAPHHIPTNPQRRERLINLADFRRTAAPEPSTSSADPDAPPRPETAPIGQNIPAADTD